MSSVQEIAETQKTLEATVLKMFTEFESKLSRSPSTKVTINSLSEEFSVFKEQTFTMFKLLKEQIKAVSRSLDILEMRHRKKCLLLNGVPEEVDENVCARVADIVSEQLKIPGVSATSFKACHRLGKLSDGHNRPILLRFADISLKSSIWRKKTAFKGTSYAVSEFLTPQRQALFIQARKVFGMKSCWTLDGNIFVKLPAGERRRLDSEEDIGRLKVSQSQQRSQSSSTPDPAAPGAEVAVVAGSSNQSARPRRGAKPPVS